MLELLLIDELERIGKKDLATEVYQNGVSEETKKILYPMFLKVISDKERKSLITIDKGIKRIERRLSRSKHLETSPLYESLQNDLERLQALKEFKFQGNYRLKKADDKYLACALASCLRTEEEEKEYTK